MIKTIRGNDIVFLLRRTQRIASIPPLKLYIFQTPPRTLRLPLPARLGEPSEGEVGVLRRNGFCLCVPLLVNSLAYPVVPFEPRNDETVIVVVLLIAL